MLSHKIYTSRVCCQGLTWWRRLVWLRVLTPPWKVWQPSLLSSTPSQRTPCSETSNWHRAQSETGSPSSLFYYSTLSWSTNFHECKGGQIRKLLSPRDVVLRERTKVAMCFWDSSAWHGNQTQRRTNRTCNKLLGRRRKMSSRKCNAWLRISTDETADCTHLWERCIEFYFEIKLNQCLAVDTLWTQVRNICILTQAITLASWL